MTRSEARRILRITTLSPGAEEVTSARRARLLEVHPDQGETPEEIGRRHEETLLVNEAAQLLLSNKTQASDLADELTATGREAATQMAAAAESALRDAGGKLVQHGQAQIRAAGDKLIDAGVRHIKDAVSRLLSPRKRRQ